MIRAAASGRLDYKHADSYDSRWMLREKLVLMDLEREIEADNSGVLVVHDSLMAVAAAVVRSKEGFNSAFDAAVAAFEHRRRALQPYISDTSPHSDEFGKMKAAWEQQFGKIGDPKTDAFIREIEMQQAVSDAQAVEARVADRLRDIAMERAIEEYNRSRSMKRSR